MKKIIEIGDQLIVYTEVCNICLGHFKVGDKVKVDGLTTSHLKCLEERRENVTNKNYTRASGNW